MLSSLFSLWFSYIGCVHSNMAIIMLLTNSFLYPPLVSEHLHKSALRFMVGTSTSLYTQYSRIWLSAMEKSLSERYQLQRDSIRKHRNTEYRVWRGSAPQIGVSKICIAIVFSSVFSCTTTSKLIFSFFEIESPNPSNPMSWNLSQSTAAMGVIIIKGCDLQKLNLPPRSGLFSSQLETADTSWGATMEGGVAPSWYKAFVILSCSVHEIPL